MTLVAKGRFRSGRGVYGFVIVAEGMWQPLYQCISYAVLVTVMTKSHFMHISEGPAQVFLLLLMLLIAAFERKNREDWKKATVS